MPALAALSEDQVHAASELRELMSPWVSTDDALLALADRFPEFDLKACTLKVATVNALYATNVYAVPRMAQHVWRVMNAEDRPFGVALVDEIARFEGRRHISFASKFAHFFVDPSLPIYDAYVARAVAYVLGSHKVWPASYAEFYGRFGQVAEPLEGRFTAKEIDQCLWLVGMYRSFREKEEGLLSGDVRALFSSPEARVRAALSRLLPQVSS